MKVFYYPGCTLKTKAKNLENAAVASLKVLGVDLEELPRWNCCGVVYSLTDDDLLHRLAPVRNLIRVKEQEADKILTLCSMCYNTLSRANLMMANDEEKQKTINDFMYEEIDYFGDLKVYHLLNFIKDEIGWDKLKEKVKKPLSDLKVAPYYGCTLLRPKEIAIDESPENPSIMKDFLTALGAEVVDFPSATECCGSYNIVDSPDDAYKPVARILKSAQDNGAEFMVSTCPMCEYNLGARQEEIKKINPEVKDMPTLYVSQLLALALGVETEEMHFEQNQDVVSNVLKQKNYNIAASV